MSPRHDTDRVLRVGIVQRGRIVEERLVRGRGTVTIGESTRNTFVLTQAR